MATTLNTGNHSAVGGPIVNFEQTTPPAFQQFLDVIPYSDHLVIDVPDNDIKTGWGVNSGALSYQWTTDDNVHLTFGLNLGLDDSSKFGAGPVFGLKYKF